MLRRSLYINKLIKSAASLHRPPSLLCCVHTAPQQDPGAAGLVRVAGYVAIQPQATDGVYAQTQGRATPAERGYILILQLGPSRKSLLFLAVMLYK